MKELVREGNTGRIIVARLNDKAELIEEIKRICKEKGVTSGYVNLIGGIEEAELISMNKTRPELENKKINHKGPFEVQGIGTIATRENEIVPHIHITLGKYGNESLTGHLVSGKITMFIELVIQEIEGIHMIRKEDPENHNLALLNFGD